MIQLMFWEGFFDIHRRMAFHLVWYTDQHKFLHCHMSWVQCLYDLVHVFFFNYFSFHLLLLNGFQCNSWFPWFLVKPNAILDLQFIVEYSVTNVSSEFPVNYLFWCNNKLYSTPGPLFYMCACMWACECVWYVC